MAYIWIIEQADFCQLLVLYAFLTKWNSVFTLILILYCTKHFFLFMLLLQFSPFNVSQHVCTVHHHINTPFNLIYCLTFRLKLCRCCARCEATFIDQNKEHSPLFFFLHFSTIIFWSEKLVGLILRNGIVIIFMS